MGLRSQYTERTIYSQSGKIETILILFYRIVFHLLNRLQCNIILCPVMCIYVIIINHTILFSISNCIVITFFLIL